MELAECTQAVPHTHTPTLLDESHSQHGSKHTQGNLSCLNPTSQHSHHAQGNLPFDEPRITTWAKGTLCLMNPASQHGSKDALGNPLLQGAWADQKGLLLKVQKRRFAFRLRKTAPGSAHFGIYMYIVICIHLARFWTVDKMHPSVKSPCLGCSLNQVRVGGVFFMVVPLASLRTQNLVLYVENILIDMWVPATNPQILRRDDKWEFRMSLRSSGAACS